MGEMASVEAIFLLVMLFFGGGKLYVLDDFFGGKADCQRWSFFSLKSNIGFQGFGRNLKETIRL